MKILPILLFLAVQAFSQKHSKDTLVRYFNAELEPCKKKEFVFIGLIIRDQGGWSGIIYDDSTRIIMRGRYKDDDCLVKNGWFMYYFSNGRRSLGGKFDNNIRQGNWLQWYPSGQLRDSIFFVNNHANGPSFSFYENGQPESAGIYRQGKYDQEWTFYYENGKPATREKYTQEKLSDLECYDSSGKSMGFNCALNRAPEIKGKYGGFKPRHPGEKLPGAGGGPGRFHRRRAGAAGRLAAGAQGHPLARSRAPQPHRGERNRYLPARTRNLTKVLIYNCHTTGPPRSSCGLWFKGSIKTGTVGHNHRSSCGGTAQRC